MTNSSRSSPLKRNTRKQPTGLWRDGKLLVVANGTVQYPKRCVKTNRSDDVSLHTIDVSKMGNATLVTGATVTGTALAMATRGPAGVFIYDMSAARQVAGPSTLMPLPFSERWMRRHKLRKLISQVWAYGGIAALVLSVVAYIFAIGASNGNDWISTLMLTCVGLVAAMMVAGLVSLLIVNQPPLRLKRKTDKHLWIQGVSPEFLAGLPDFIQD